MSANDWEKSWKNQLDKYDSPVDSGLFESITSRAAVKSGSPFLFGWIGLGFVVLSSALIIAGSNSKSNHDNVIVKNNSEILPASISAKKSNIDLLSAALYDPAIAYEMSNSGKYVTAHQSNSKIDILKTKNQNEDMAPANHPGKPTHSATGINVLEKDVSTTSGILAETSALNTESDFLNSGLISSGAEMSFEDAKVRFNATRALSVLFPVTSKNNKLLLKFPDPDNCFNDAKGRSSFYIDAYVGAGNSIRSLSAVQGEEIYRNMRDSLEKSWYNSAAGARIGFILSSGMAIETGAEYQVHNEIFEYKNESEVRITYKYHYDQLGTLTRIDTITEIGARTLRTHNKYQQITIPLRLGYTMEKGRWMLGARLGVGLHIWNHQHGIILDNAYQTYKIEDDPQKYFNKNWGMQYNASVQIGYRILPQTFLMIEPVWNSQSSGITKTPYTIDQKYQTLRLNVGVRFVPGSY